MRKAVLILAAFAPLAACSTVAETVRGPELAPIGYPAALIPAQQAYLPARETTPASANSLWRTGARTFFGDQRARHIGDILTVKIDIDDRAQTQNSTQRSRSNEINAGVSNLFGLESSLGRAFPGGFDPSKMVGMEGDLKSSGNGSVTRAEKVSLTIAAVVTDVLANGNLVIQGQKNLRLTQGDELVQVQGIVRAADIAPDNSVPSSKVADARIAYGGRGAIAQSNAMGWLSRFFNSRLSPY